MILCIILAFFISLFIYLHAGFSPVVIDKNIHKRTTVLLKSEKKIVKKNTNLMEKPKNLFSKIWEHNLFDPLRGELEGTIGSTELSKGVSDMELIGICDTDTLKGAIILLKNNKFRYISKNKDLPMPKKNQRKRFFRIEERLPNGYTLKEINSNVVSLNKGNEQVILKLKFDDNETTGRVSSIASNSVKAQLNKIKREKTRSLLNINKAKASVEIVPIENYE
jgi:hypothetical protein